MLVSALEAEKVLWEQARTECTKEDSDCESKMTAAELPRGAPQCNRQRGEGVARSLELDRASGSSVRSKSHSDADSDNDKQQQAREAEAGPKNGQGSQTKEDRELEPEDGRGQQQGFQRQAVRCTTSEDEAML